MHQLAPKHVESLREERVVAVSVGVFHTIAASTRDCSVFGWGRAEGLGLPEAITFEVVQPGEDGDDEEREVCIMSPHRYPQLSCVPRSIIRAI